MSAIGDLLTKGSPNDTANTKRLLRDTFVEFVATTLFIFAGTLSASSTGMQIAVNGDTTHVARTLPIAMVFGISIMTFVFSIGHITGGHMNPGISLTMFLRRQISFVKMLCYWFAQFLGGILGASITWGCISNLSGTYIDELDIEFQRPAFTLGSTILDPSLSSSNGFLLEFMGSSIFYFVVAQTALDKRGIANTAFPAIPIGFSLIAVHVCLIPFTGCGVNPARTFGPSMVVCMTGEGCEDVAGSWYWIYYVGPFLASWFVAELSLLLQMDVGDAVMEPTSEAAIESDAMKAAREIEATPTAIDDENSPVEVGAS